MHDKIFAKICKTTLTYRMTPLNPVLLKINSTLAHEGTMLLQSTGIC